MPHGGVRPGLDGCGVKELLLPPAGVKESSTTGGSVLAHVAELARGGRAEQLTAGEDGGGSESRAQKSRTGDDGPEGAGRTMSGEGAKKEHDVGRERTVAW